MLNKKRRQNILALLKLNPAAATLKEMELRVHKFRLASFP